MCVNRPSVCIVVVTLLCAVAYSKRRFDYANILSTYRNLIVPELQQLNLTGASFASEGKDCCPSEKVHRIFRSICGMTKQYLNNTGQQGEIGRVVQKMEFLITERCKKVGMVKQRTATCKDAKLQKLKEKCLKRKKRRRDHCRREEKMKLVQMLVFCWQKLQSATP
ncbi:hypothetical protein AALO_G00047970 [Alosa alosa]|uniref:Uncharacterized protein n=1 Tax=Alosa alosa TaxID=278164 RepID=A0AAV6H312_9TELE|nr:hypothetical protein AALO_G00047970 [Alosa alosa]